MFRRPPFLLPLLLTSPVIAHHGRDFLLVQDYTTPAPLSGIVYSNFGYASLPGPDEWSAEPGAMLGLTPWMALGSSGRFADEGDGWHYSSVSPQVQFRLTPEGYSLPIRFGAIAGYEFARDRQEHEHETVCGPAYGPDAPPCEEAGDGHTHPGGHTHGGIHQHGTDHCFARLIMETDVSGKDKLVVNIITVVPDGGDAAFGYAAGLRHSFSHRMAAGVEAVGDFDRHGYHEAVLAGYFSPGHHCTLKLGLGAGLTDESPGFTLHGGAVWRF